MKSNRWPIWLIAGIIALVAVSWGLYVYADPEHLDLDDVARARLPGQFAKLSDGYTHYEMGGPAEGSGGRVVVLTAGFSVPYYIWDPTFAALTGAGLRVLRYDYYGRGYSDRPNIAYTQDLYVRQLTQLLDALNIRGPVDLAADEREPVEVRHVDVTDDEVGRPPENLVARGDRVLRDLHVVARAREV